MRQLAAIGRRETGSFFRSAMAPVVLTGFLLLTGLFFTLFVFGYSELSRSALTGGHPEAALNLNEGVFQPLVSDMTIFLLFLLPAVAMRLFSEEYRSGRDVLVMSYPVADHVWVVGKWLSVMATAGVLIAASLAFFGVAASLGHPEPGPLASALIGLVLLSAAIGAWGVFFSALFQYQVVAYFLTFAFAFVLFLIGGLETHVAGAWGRIASELSLSDHFMRLSWGVVDSRDIIYFAGLTVLGLAGATAAVSGRRLAARGRWIVWSPTVVLAVLLAVVYAIAAHHPFAADWTRDRRYSLAPQTEQVLRSLDSDIEVTAFYQRLDPQRKTLEVLLRACQNVTPHIRWEMLDPERELSKVQEYGVGKARTVILEAGDRRRDLLAPDENAFVNAVYRLATGTRPVVYHVLGDGEHQPDSDERGGYSGYAELLASQGYELRILLLAEKQRVPADADIVVLAGPKRNPAPEELAALDAYIAGGGAVLALLEPGTPPAVERWIGEYDIGLGRDLIYTAQRGSRDYGVDAWVVMVYDSYGNHEITHSLEGMPTLFPRAQSLYSLGRDEDGIDETVLLRTGPFSWAERDSQSYMSPHPRFDEGTDLRGPLSFGVALEIGRDRGPGAGISEGPRAAEPPLPDDPVIQRLAAMRESHGESGPRSIFSEQDASRMVVIGDSDFASNANLNLYGNRDLLLNILGWLGRESDLIARRAPPGQGELIVLTVGRKEAIGWGCIFGWPLLVGGGSLATVLVRRRRRPAGGRPRDGS